MNRLMHNAIAAITVLSLCSCASPQVVQQRFFWPEPPDEPRVEWIGSYSNVADMKLNDGKSWLTAIVGEEPSVSLQRPMSVASDGKGKVYVSESEGSNVLVFDFKAKEINRFGGSDYSEAFEQVNGVYVDAAGNAYASDSRKRKILVVTPENKPLKIIDVSAHTELIGKFAIDNINKHLVLTDIKKHRIVITDMEGKLIKSFGSKGDADGLFNFPNAVAIDKDGSIIVCDSLNARIQRFTSKGEFVSKFGRRGDGPGDFSLIKGVAVDSEGHIYVTDGKDHRLSIFSPKGELLLIIGGQFAQTPGSRTALAGFLVPQGVFIDQNDRIYIVDQLNKRIQIFQYLNERYLSQFPVPVKEVK